MQARCIVIVLHFGQWIPAKQEVQKLTNAAEDGILARAYRANSDHFGRQARCLDDTIGQKLGHIVPCATTAVCDIRFK